MPRSARLLLAWILVALLPLQGYAAAAMISCGPMHAQPAANAEKAHHEHRDRHSDHQHDHQEAVGTGDTESAPALPDLLKFKCSACAACCTGAAAPSPSVPLVSLTKSQAIPSLFFDWSDHSIVPSGVERPPRAALA